MMVVFEIYDRIELGTCTSQQTACLLVSKKNHIRQKLPTLKDVPRSHRRTLTWSLKSHEFNCVNREKLSSSLH